MSHCMIVVAVFLRGTDSTSAEEWKTGEYTRAVRGAADDGTTVPDTHATRFSGSFTLLASPLPLTAQRAPAARPRTPEEQAGYVAGMMVGGLLILGIAVWVLYRMTRNPYAEPPRRPRRRRPRYDDDEDF